MEFERDQRQLASLRRLPAVTRDGTAVDAAGQCGVAAGGRARLAAGAEGIGLLRTEFLFMNRADLPDEEEQYEALRALVRALDGRPMTVRTLDVGGDKLAPALARSPRPCRQSGARPARHPPVAEGAASCWRPSSAPSCAPVRPDRCASCCR